MKRRIRVGRSAGIVVLTLALAQALLVAHTGQAAADPPNMSAVAPQVPDAINAAIGAPPFPRLAHIPQRAQAPGFGHRLLELREATLPDPTGDPFFDRWAPDLSAYAPGSVLAVRDVTATAAPLVTAPIRKATQIKFTTRDATGRPSFGTATIVVPQQPWRGHGARPIVVNNLPIDALGAACTPGMTLSHGVSIATGATDYVPPTTQLALAHGYTVLIPDHQGPRMAYAEPTTAGHIVLDSVRASAALDPRAFGTSRVAMSGYSGGAIATNGAAALLGTYAPELVPRFVGAALGGVPADFRMLVGSMNANLATGLFHAATFGIARERPEILTLANHPAQWIATSPLKNVCTIPAAVAGSTFMPMQLMSNVGDPFHSPVAESIYRLTTMSGRRDEVPLYIYNGTYEWWIPAAGARDLFHKQCQLGANATYREVFGEHATAAILGFGDAMTWLDARLRGIPARSGCP